MNQPSRLTLAEARKQGKLDEFIAERENDPQGDQDALDETIGQMVRTSSEARPASSKDCADD